ncbi:protein KINESIN LIGHT CHAIN-RELATED 3-like [Abrus precatorius]|uniref:Protein KINESIN LIGHT CHAIN-RELATED 3-like n=1 Tax=Abrus precatorius TaxID=3816 RepID=A0A8B8MMM4_ABRPR|nr:protein KINESIN LIGHT CHAIN-RELATED 3-like [Abrus precatorius]
MPGIVITGVNNEGEVNEMSGTGNTSPFMETLTPIKSPRSSSSPQRHQNADPNLPVDGVVDTSSIERLSENVCDMQSSDQSSSTRSLGSAGYESKINSELHNLVEEKTLVVEVGKKEVQKKTKGNSSSKASSRMGSLSNDKKLDKIRPATASSVFSETSSKSRPKGKSTPPKPPVDRKNDNPLRKENSGITRVKKSVGRSVSQIRVENSTESALYKPELGPALLKQARDMISSGDNPQKALELALQAVKLFEKTANGKPSLDIVMCFHVTAAIYCTLGHFNEAIPIIKRSIEIPVIEEGQQHAIAKFAGHMQLGDIYAVVGQLENSIKCYTAGLEIQRKVLGETDPRVGETCRYAAEANFQAMQFDEAERLCQMALDIHRANGSPSSLEEAADRRLMGLICEANGNHEAALEHLVLASIAMVENGEGVEVASVDCSIGDTYLSLARYDEAIFAYQRALTVLKTHKGENHPAVGLVLVRLADLYNRTWKTRESKSYCENALRIYENPMPGVPSEEIASGLMNVSAIYESMNELEQALKLLHKALGIHNDAPGQQSTIAGIEAQIGVMYYMLGNYTESYNAFQNAVSKLRVTGEKKSAYFGTILNQMGLACVQLHALSEATQLFEEARIILEQENGPYHPETLGVYSNLAGTYDAMGRVDEAIEILEHIVGTREEKLGTANPDVVYEKRRLHELLKETGRVRKRKTKSLEILLDANVHKSSSNLIIHFAFTNNLT